MTKIRILNSYWFPMAIDAVKFLDNGKRIEDYKLFCKNQPRNLKGSFADRMEVLELLTEQKIILNNNGNLTMHPDPDFSCFNEGLAAGYEDAWEFVDLIGKSKAAEKKFDNSKNIENGLMGEEFIVSELKKTLPEEKFNQINHVSLKDDTKGYDIEFENENNILKFLEVKTSSLPGNNFSFFLSRNEYEVGKLKNDDWSIVLVKLFNGNPVFFGALTLADLNEYLPLEKFENNAQWYVMKFFYESDGVNYRNTFSEFVGA
ncbi:MAG: DUF3883 domain-containing protein [Parvibaculales bacterium]